jgi:predicted restriction endonuclease
MLENGAVIEERKVLRLPNPISALQSLYQHKCQVCGITFEFDGKRFIQTHHIDPSKGDVWANLLVVCPNHHFEIETALANNVPVVIDLRKHEALVSDRAYSLRVMPEHLES